VTVSNYGQRIASPSLITLTPVTGKLEAKAYPNPFSSNAIIEIKNAKPNARIVVELFNSTGRKIAILYDQHIKQSGLYQVPVNASTLLSGIYTYRVISGDEIINSEIILIK
jgi:hypothetical protein